MLTLSVVFVLGASVLLPVASFAAPSHVDAELLSEVRAIEAGQPFRVAVRLKMDPQWHTYWQNPGSSGEATSIDWNLPDGFSAGPILWPAPRKLPIPPLVNYGYEDEVLLMTKIMPPGDLTTGREVEIKAEVKWLECKEKCFPGRASLTLALPVRSEVEPSDSAITKTFARFERRLPEEPTGWDFDASRKGEDYLLSVRPPRTTASGWAEDLYYFDARSGVVDPTSAQRSNRIKNGRYELTIPRSEYATGEPTRLRGVLSFGRGDGTASKVRALRLDVPIENRSAGTNSTVSTVPGGTPGYPGLLGLAFLGGMILNLMPCVFPVLSIKVFEFVNHAHGGSSRDLRLQSLFYTAGILVSFWVLAGGLLALRAGGEKIGWGFQLQSPTFVAALSFFFFLLALNLFDVFEWGTSLMNLGGSLEEPRGYSGSFSSGVLATVVATPCTAPFMGTALGVAVTLPSVEAIGIFTALGGGLAFPYVLFSWFPEWSRILPEPGDWMETFKHLLAFPLLGAVVWLVGVYGELTGIDRLEQLLVGLCLAALGAWIYGRWGGFDREKIVRVVAGFSAVALILGGFAMTWAGAGSSESDWKPYSKTVLEKSIERGRPVFVDFTAAWCVTCQVNKQTTLNRDGVREAFENHNVLTLRADWTRRDPEITEALAKFNRNAVPFYVLYPGRQGMDPIILPEVLTPGIVKDALSELPGRST